MASVHNNQPTLTFRTRTIHPYDFQIQTRMHAHSGRERREKTNWINTTQHAWVDALNHNLITSTRCTAHARSRIHYKYFEQFWFESILICGQVLHIGSSSNEKSNEWRLEEEDKKRVSDGYAVVRRRVPGLIRAPIGYTFRWNAHSNGDDEQMRGAQWWRVQVCLH